MKQMLWMLLVLSPAIIAKAHWCESCPACGIAVAAYQQPVIYQSPVVYHGAVFYYGPVYYMASMAAAGSYALCEEPRPASTVIHITKGGTYSYSRFHDPCFGSTVIHIPDQPRHTFRQYQHPRRTLRR